MSDDINRLRELAGINQEPVKNKSKKLDEGVLGGMQDINHVSVKETFYPDFNPRIEGSDIVIDINGQPHYLTDDSVIGLSMGDIDNVMAFPENSEGYHDRFNASGELEPDQLEQLVGLAKEVHSSRFPAKSESEMENNKSVGESDMDNFANDVDEEVLVDKEQRIVDDAKSMIARGMDPDSVIMSLASEYGLSDEEQFDLYNVVVQDHSPVEEDEDQETMRGRQAWEQGDTEESHTVDWEEVRNAAADAAKTIFGNVDQSALDGIINDTKRDVDDYANTEDAVQIAINKMRQDEGVNEDFDNGYDKQVEVDADGYFPRGAHNAVDDDAGPSSAKHGDNPMQKKMDVNESKGIHQGLVSNYRLFKKS